MSDLARTSANLAAKQRMRTLGDLDSAALMLREAWITLAHAAADPEQAYHRTVLVVFVAASR
ncbi:hypothetical protein [Salinispora arenicola]|uniref:hypothetical protein n=1 Tax=Salinispora arenicola TaxID=168697 RepID=UPI0003721CFE|nr:hypothetical protein [Salinispora arenicola]